MGKTHTKKIAKQPVKRIVIVLEEGLVRDIISDIPVTVLVKDIDKGAEEEVIYTLWDPDEVTVAPKEVLKVFKDLERDRTGGREV
jgi:hypothetical protein